MISLSNLTAQTLQPGQAVTFDKVNLKSGCGECHNSLAPASTKLCAKGIYEINFSGNITGAAAAALQLAVAIGGEPIVQSTMNSVSAAEGDLHNVSTSFPIHNCYCDIDRITVVNSGAVPVTLAPNSVLYIKGQS